jgi:iron complex transport system substrate-binding protein
MKVALIRFLQIGVFASLIFFLESIAPAQAQVPATAIASVLEPVAVPTSVTALEPAFTWVAASPPAPVSTPQRLVTLGGSVTEIVYALGAGDRVVATDQSSIYPVQATQLPSVGYYRLVPTEGVVAMRPDLVLASNHAGPPLALRQIQDLGIPIELVSDEPNMTSLHHRIRQIAKVLNQQEAGEKLIDQVNQQVNAARLMPVKSKSAILLVMRGGKLLGAGGNTTANVVIQLSGLQNVLTALNSYQVITPEAVSAAAPEVIIVTRSTVKAIGGLDQVKAEPALRHTPAVKNGRVIVLDDLLAQGFGPRIGLAIQHIRQALANNE